MFPVVALALAPSILTFQLAALINGVHPNPLNLFFISESIRFDWLLQEPFCFEGPIALCSCRFMEKDAVLNVTF